MKCLYIWRFQPVHSGHLDVINQIFDHGYQEIIIGIGSSNVIDEKNPRSFPQRKAFMLQALNDRWVDMNRVSIVGIPDFTVDEDWVSYIKNTIEFDAVMSWNQWVVKLFRSNNMLVLEEIERIPIHATDIRMLLKNKKYNEIKKWVTPGVFTLLCE